MPDQYNQALMHSMNPMNSFMFEDDSMSPDPSAWQNGDMEMQPPSLQTDIGHNHGNTVVHQFGQITPPDDDASKALALASYPMRSTPAPSQAIHAKSERARAAANSRHAKAKKARKDSVRKVEDLDDGEEDGVEGKREKYREKNRLAAAKCRAKKKMNTEDLEESARSASAQNNRLRAEERELRDLFSSLRDRALAHDPSQGCNCQAIHAYNMHKAHEAARATMGFVPGVMPSPSQHSIDSASPGSIGAISRTESFSGVRPSFARDSSRSQSLASSGKFHPSTPAGEALRNPSIPDERSKCNHAFAPVTTAHVHQDSPITKREPEDVQDILHEMPEK